MKEEVRNEPEPRKILQTDEALAIMDYEEEFLSALLPRGIPRPTFLAITDAGQTVSISTKATEDNPIQTPQALQNLLSELLKTGKDVNFSIREISLTLENAEIRFQAHGLSTINPFDNLIVLPSGRVISDRVVFDLRNAEVAIKHSASVSHQSFVTSHDNISPQEINGLTEFTRIAALRPKHAHIGIDINRT